MSAAARAEGQVSSAPVILTSPRVAVYRSTFLARSETFVRDHLLDMPGFETVPVASWTLPDPLPVPGKETVVAGPRSIRSRAVTKIAKRLPRTERFVHDLALTEALRSVQPALVHAHFGPDGADIMRACQRLALPLVVTFHGYDATSSISELRKGRAGAWMIEHWQELIGYSTAIVTVSEFMRGIMLEKGVPAEKLHVIACGVKPPRTPPPDPPDEPRALFVGRLVEKKGVLDLLEAAAQVPGGVDLDIVGDGPLRAELERCARASGVRARFLGMLDSAGVRERMIAASVVCMPSKRAASGDSEGLGVTALEAGALARPVVGYRHGGLAEAVLDGRTGLLATEGDVGGLAQRLTSVLSDGELARSLGEAAFDHVRTTYNSVDLLARMGSVYRGVLTSSPPPR